MALTNALRRGGSLLAIMLSFLTGMAQANDDVFELEFQNVPEQAQRDIRQAAANWSACLVTEAPIQARFTWIARGPTGFALPRAVRDLAHLPVQGAWYPTALANALKGARDGDTDDMNIFLSARTNWYFASDTPIGDDQTDFINVVMHEIAHGLGISSASFIPWQGDRIGAIGFPNEFVTFFDLSFPLPELDGTPSLYDTFVRLADGRSLMSFQNPSARLADVLSNPTLHFDGPRTIAANDGLPVGVVAGNISHIPQYPGRMTPIMLPDSGKGETVHTPDAILLGMLADLGWTIADICFERAE